MTTEEFIIEKEYITLGQLLQASDHIQSGGQAKWFLSEYAVYINDELDNRRGRKLYPGDIIEIPVSEKVYEIVSE